MKALDHIPQFDSSLRFLTWTIMFSVHYPSVIKPGIPLRQHRNMLHSTCLSFNKKCFMQLSTFLECHCCKETLFLPVVCNTLCWLLNTMKPTTLNQQKLSCQQDVCGSDDHPGLAITTSVRNWSASYANHFVFLMG